MNIKKYNSFSTKDIKSFDMAIAFAYKGFDIHQYRKVGFTVMKPRVLRSVMYANKIVGDYLRGV